MKNIHSHENLKKMKNGDTCLLGVSMWALLGDTMFFDGFLASPLYAKRRHLLKKESYY